MIRIDSVHFLLARLRVLLSAINISFLHLVLGSKWQSGRKLMYFLQLLSLGAEC